MTPTRNTFSRDVLWNVVSLGVAGLCGIGVNYLIGIEYGASALGVFTQVSSIYLVTSQVAALGVHGSVLYHIAASQDPRERRDLLTAALLLALVTSAALAGLFVAASGAFGALVGSDEVATGMRWAAPALVFFSLDKVLLAALNGIQRMRTYAVFQAGRVVLMAAALGGCVAMRVRPSTLPVILSIGEGATLVLALAAVRDHLGPAPLGVLSRWWRAHLRFGARGFLSGLVYELNNRIDVIILGAYASDAIVGAYSFAALLAEGMYQVLVALRTNYAPIMVRLLANRDAAELDRVVRRARARTYAGAAVVGAVTVAGYALIVPRVTHDPEVARSGLYFAILIAGMVASAGYAPFSQLLLWAGRPGWHTVMIAIVVIPNAALCVALVVAGGALGASVATAVTYAGSVVLLRVMAARVLGVRI